MKRLYRSDDNKVFAGVCGGLGEYTDVDPVLYRVLWVIITVLTGFFPGLIAYIITIFVVPPYRKGSMCGGVTMKKDAKEAEQKVDENEQKKEEGE
ncbi:MAG: PspC domain-containing protein [Candidatus Yonathbacteria bacterium]|nr:PspC domain-containing protein [Candidatus Yonathbacteria bacterium]